MSEQEYEMERVDEEIEEIDDDIDEEESEEEDSDGEVKVEEEEPKKRKRKPTKYVLVKGGSEIKVVEGLPKDFEDGDSCFRVMKEITPVIKVQVKKTEKDHFAAIKEEDPYILRITDGEEEGKKNLELGKLSKIGIEYGELHYILQEKDMKPKKAWGVIKTDVKFLAVLKTEADAGEEAVHRCAISKDGTFPGIKMKQIETVYEVTGEAVYDIPTKGTRRNQDDETYIFIENVGPMMYHDIEDKHKKNRIFVLGKAKQFKVSF